MEIRQSCPHGLTQSDLIELFPDVVDRGHFYKWMTGQTMSICDGRTYHHDRVHDFNCRRRRIFLGKEELPHTDDSAFDYRCGYTGTGHYEDTVCKNNPHGPVVYPWDVKRYLMGLPVID